MGLAIGNLESHVGYETLFGLMNSMGILGGAGAQLFVGWMADLKGSQGFSGRDQWDPALFYFVAVLFAGAVAWDERYRIDRQ